MRVVGQERVRALGSRVDGNVERGVGRVTRTWKCVEV